MTLFKSPIKGRGVVPGMNDLATLCPYVEHIWDYFMNDMAGIGRPENYSVVSTVIAWFHCGNPLHRPYQAMIRNIAAHHMRGRCPDCSSAAGKFPFIIELWDYELNDDTPWDVSPFAEKKRWFHCGNPLHDSWFARVADITSGKSHCPQCSSNKKPTVGVNDMGTMFPMIAGQWDYELNARDNIGVPSDYRPSSGVKAWFHCPHGHPSYLARISDRTANGSGCPACALNIVIAGVNDLQSQCPQVAYRWSDKNYELGYGSPSECAWRTPAKRWFKCDLNPLHPDFECSVSNMTDSRYHYGIGACPHCKGSGLEQRIRKTIMDEMNLKYEDIVVESKLKYEDNGRMSNIELDMFVPEYNIAFEMNGSYWHSDEIIMDHYHISAAEYHQRKLAACRQHGIRLFFIWEDDWIEYTDDVINAIHEVFNGMNPIILSRVNPRS